MEQCAHPTWSHGMPDVCDAGAASTCGVEGPAPPLLDLPQIIGAFTPRSAEAVAEHPEPILVATIPSGSLSPAAA